MVTKTESDVNETTLLGDIAARTAMTLLGQNPRKPKGKGKDQNSIVYKESARIPTFERFKSKFQCLQK